MYRWFTYIFSPIFFCALLCGCINKDVDCESQRNIFFSAAVDELPSVTKSAALYPSDFPFRVWGYKLPSEKSWTKQNGDALPVFDDIQAKYYNGFWHTPQLHLWPEHEYKMNFFAFAPSASDATFSFDKGVEFEGFSIKENSDFLYADPIVNMSKPVKDAPVQLIFRSPLSNVAFDAYAVSTDNITITITGLVLKNLNTTGHFKQYVSPYWFDLGGKEECRIFSGELELSGKSSFVAEKIIIPQRVFPVLYYKYHIDGTYADIEREVVLDTEDIPLPQFGGMTVYTIKVTPYNVEILNPRK